MRGHSARKGARIGARTVHGHSARTRSRRRPGLTQCRDTTYLGGHSAGTRLRRCATAEHTAPNARTNTHATRHHTRAPCRKQSDALLAVEGKGQRGAKGGVEAAHLTGKAPAARGGTTLVAAREVGLQPQRRLAARDDEGSGRPPLAPAAEAVEQPLLRPAARPPPHLESVA